MVNGVVYATAGTRRAVVALDAATGELLWMHSENEGKRGEAAPRQLSGRGLAYWTDGAATERILYVTPGLPAGRARREDRRAGRRLRQERHRRSEDGRRPGDRSDHRRDRPARDADRRARTSSSSAPRICPAACRTSKTNEKGYVRGFDVRTGKRLWIFHTIPQPGEFGNDTWEKDSWSYTGNAGVVGADRRSTRSSASSTCPSSCRPATTTAAIVRATDLFGESARRGRSEDRQAEVALPARAPRHLGHGHPVRADPRRHHRQRPHDQGDRAADQAGVALRVRSRPTASRCGRSKSGRSPKGDVPGEWYSPTQPFVTKPPAFDRQGVSVDDLIDFTPELKAEALKLVSRYKIGPIFTPIDVSKSKNALTKPELTEADEAMNALVGRMLFGAKPQCVMCRIALASFSGSTARRRWANIFLQERSRRRRPLPWRPDYLLRKRDRRGCKSGSRISVVTIASRAAASIAFLKQVVRQRR